MTIWSKNKEFPNHKHFIGLLQTLVIHERCSFISQRIQQIDIYYNIVDQIDMSVGKTKSVQW